MQKKPMSAPEVDPEVDQLEINASDSDDDLFEHHRVEVDKGQGVLRIDKFLFDRLEKTSRTRIQDACDNGFVKVGGTPVKSSYKIKPLDVITIELPFPVRELELIAENIPFEENGHTTAKWLCRIAGDVTRIRHPHCVAGGD